MTATYHTPVLLHEALDYLITERGGVYVDGTLGGGGHAMAICERVRGGMVIGLDADSDAIQYATERLRQYSNARVGQYNFRELRRALAEFGIAQIHGLLLDLGVSSYQLDAGEKGFSFREDERIDMRMDRRQPLSGWDVVNTYDEDRLAGVLREYGEERNARLIARRICRRRPLHTTGALAAVIEQAVGQRFLTKTLARVFQAIRIEVNRELENLEAALAESVELMASGGRIVVIAYHSLEDRIVKSFFKKESATHKPSGHKLIPDEVLNPRLRVLTPSPVTATDAEVAVNPRARSAKLRAAERI